MDKSILEAVGEVIRDIKQEHAADLADVAARADDGNIYYVLEKRLISCYTSIMPKQTNTSSQQKASELHSRDIFLSQPYLRQ